MKPNPETTPERELEGATSALRRAAQQARLIARRTHTPLVLGKGGRVEKRWLEGEAAALREDAANYGGASPEAPPSKDSPLD